MSETSIVIRANKGDITGHPNALPEKKLRGGEKVGYFIDDQRSGWCGCEKGAQAVVEARVGFLPIG